MDSKNNFLAALAAFQPQSPVAIEYRIYYDRDSGQVLNYTNDDVPGDYIVVDKDTFARHRFDCLIRDGKIVPYRLPIGKLVPSESGVACDPEDITVISVDGSSSQHWRMRTYED